MKGKTFFWKVLIGISALNVVLFAAGFLFARA
jgi:hypothetical protein